MVLGCSGVRSLVNWPVRKSALVLELLVNFLLPWICYRMVSPALGETRALFVSASPPMIWSLWMVVGFKRLDVISLLVICGILLSLLATAFGGSPRLLLRESLIIGFVGFALLVSLLFPSPLMYYLAAIDDRASFSGRSSAIRRALGETGLRSVHVCDQLGLGHFADL